MKDSEVEREKKPQELRLKESYEIQIQKSDAWGFNLHESSKITKIKKKNTGVLWDLKVQKNNSYESLYRLHIIKTFARVLLDSKVK